MPVVGARQPSYFSFAGLALKLGMLPYRFLEEVDMAEDLAPRSLHLCCGKRAYSLELATTFSCPW
jgi:hypothetical protein